MKTIIAFFLFFGLANAYAHDYHKTTTVQNVTNVSQNTKGVALAIAAAQHHYKATKALQWSVGGGHINNESAVSFGLGLQAGKVFVSGNFSSDGSSSAIGVGASGTF